MSIQNIQSNIERIHRDIESLQKNLTDESKKEARKAERVSQVRQSISRTSSPTTIKTKQREIEHLEHEIVQIQKKKADLTKRIADKTRELHKYQQQLAKEHDLEQKKLLDSLKRQNDEMKQRQEELLSQLKRTTMVDKSEGAALEYDAFISHASEDKEDLVRPLAEMLQNAGFSIWYDELQLKVGDSLRRSIDKGLAKSRFGIVVLSPNFFAKNWPQYELDGLVVKEMSGGGKVILPLWHKVSKDEVMHYSPSLADKVALNTAIYTIDELVEKFGEILK